MEHQDKIEAILFIRPNAEFVLRGEDVEWLDSNQQEPNVVEIQQAWIALQEKRKIDLEAEEEKKNAALKKLQTLGLTKDDLTALGF